MTFDNTSIAHADIGIQTSLAQQTDLDCEIRAAERSGNSSKAMSLKSQVASQLSQFVREKAAAERDMLAANQLEVNKAQDGKLKELTLKHLDPAELYTDKAKAKPTVCPGPETEKPTVCPGPEDATEATSSSSSNTKKAH
jgi:hypothetical protein